jgi:hypothetical protein
MCNLTRAIEREQLIGAIDSALDDRNAQLLNHAAVNVTPAR